MFFIKKITLAVSFTMFASMCLAEGTVSPEQPLLLAYGLTPEQVMVYEGKELTGKKEREILDNVLCQYPDGILRLEIAQKEALKIFTHLMATNMDENTVSVALKNIIAPAKKFLSAILWASNMVLPVLQESLIADYPKYKETGIFPDKVILIRFFNRNNSDKDLDSFFATQAKTREEKLEACSEFLVFFQDLKKNLSAKTWEAYNKFRTDLIKFQAAQRAKGQPTSAQKPAAPAA